MPKKALKKTLKKALMVYGGWEGHEPKQTSDRFAAYLRTQGFEVIQSSTLDSYCDQTLMESLNLIVQTVSCSEISGKQWRGLRDAVRAGVGLAGWHGGIVDSYRGNIEYQWMTGGQFLCHPGNLIDYEVHVSAWDDPIVAGLSDFTVTSEQYYLLVDPANVVLATTTFDGVHDAFAKGTVMPVVWKRKWGAGRVFVNCIGHVDSDFEVPEARIIMERGLLWAAK
jgi:type 1 glutamine amidotransferase